MNRIRTPLFLFFAAISVIGLLAISVIGILVLLGGTPVAQSVNTYLVALTGGTVSPSPSPSPVVAHDAASNLLLPSPSPVVVPTAVPTAVPAPVPPPVESFPVAAAPVAPPVGQPTLPPMPSTMVTVSIGSASGAQLLGSGPLCAGTCTIDWSACFQGGFTGSRVQLCGAQNTDPSLTFTWSDGHVGPVNSVTYSTPGKTVITVRVSESYQGHTYAAGSANAVPVTVT